MEEKEKQRTSPVFKDIQGTKNIDVVQMKKEAMSMGITPMTTPASDYRVVTPATSHEDGTGSTQQLPQLPLGRVSSTQPSTTGTPSMITPVPTTSNRGTRFSMSTSALNLFGYERDVSEAMQYEDMSGTSTPHKKPPQLDNIQISIPSIAKQKNITGAVQPKSQAIDVEEKEIKERWQSYHKDRVKSTPSYIVTESGNETKGSLKVLSLEDQSKRVSASQGSARKINAIFFETKHKMELTADKRGISIEEYVDEKFSPQTPPTGDRNRVKPILPSKALALKEKRNMRCIKLMMLFNRENFLFLLNILPQLSMIAYSADGAFSSQPVKFWVPLMATFGTLLVLTLLTKCVCFSGFEKSAVAKKSDDIPSISISAHKTLPLDSEQKQQSKLDFEKNISVQVHPRTPSGHKKESSFSDTSKKQVPISDMHLFEPQKSVSIREDTEENPDFIFVSGYKAEEQDNRKNDPFDKLVDKHKKATRPLPISKHKGRENMLFLLGMLTQVGGLGYGIFKLYTEISSEHGLEMSAVFTFLMTMTCAVKFFDWSQVKKFFTCTDACSFLKHSTVQKTQASVDPMETEITPRSVSAI